MSFVSLTFALFLGVSVPLYWLCPPRLRQPLLLFLSLFFYASSSLGHALLITVLLTLVFGISLRLHPEAPDSPRRALLVSGILVCVCVLGFFKYTRMALETLARLGGPEIAAPDVRVPLGISFFTFEFVHYLVDVRAGRIARPSPKDYLHFALFSLFFPTLLAGPIKRYQVFERDGAAQARFRADCIAEGLVRMLIGLAKKLIVADSMTAFSVRLLVPDQVTPLGLWIATYAYGVKIYFDFAAYSDLAIGAARLFGYRIPENFDWPYLRRNLSEFWRHWHISLSSWIRDYLFIPLGGSRVGSLRTLFNLTLVMALCGLWHGASWNFVLWGLWHGVGLGGLRLWQRLHERAGSGAAWIRLPRPIGQVVATLLTFNYVNLGWVLFATPTLQAAGTAYRRMFALQ